MAPGSSASIEGRPSSSFTGWSVSGGFSVYQARGLRLHLSSALSFSVCVQGRLRKTFSDAYTRKAGDDLAPWILTHTNVTLPKHCPTGSHASQQRMSVAKGLLRQAIIVIAAIKTLAPWLVAVARSISWRAQALALPTSSLKSGYTCSS